MSEISRCRIVEYRVGYANKVTDGWTPAIVTHVWDAEEGLVNLHVLDAGVYATPTEGSRTSVKPGDQIGDWRWPLGSRENPVKDDAA